MLQTKEKINLNGKAKVYNLLSLILDYPHSENYKQIVQECINALKENNNKEAFLLGKFYKFIENMSLEEMQEFYTHTFDIGAFAPLYIGYHLFGESYERGKILVALRSIYKVKNIAEKGELPDFLPTVLRFMAIYNTDESEKEIVQKYVIPGMQKIAAAFSKSENAYKYVLKVILNLVMDNNN